MKAALICRMMNVWKQTTAATEHEALKHHLPESMGDFVSPILFLFMDADLLRKQLDDGLITPDILLSGTKLVDESSRESVDYKDGRHFPFYYHLGKQLKPKVVYQIGAKLGLIGACFLRSCKTVEDWLAMDNDRDFTATIITSNLKLHTEARGRIQPGAPVAYMGLNDELLEMNHHPDFTGVDLCFLTENFGEERYLKHLNFLWKVLKPEGLLVADYITAHDVFHEFCRVKNREPEIFKTRYGVGIIQR